MSAIVGATLAVGSFALWYFGQATPAIPQRPLRIGFENNPPVQVRTDRGYSGLAVDIVNEAAKRAGIELVWVETGTSSEEALRKRLVDLWPLMVDRPYRRKFVHFAPPWMHSNNVLVLREATRNPDHGFKGRIGVYKIPLHIRLIHEGFPEAKVVEISSLDDVARQVCTGAVDAGFFEARVAQHELSEQPAECASTSLRVQQIPGMTFRAGVASTIEAAGAADRIEREIEKMFRDGTLAVSIARYSYFGLDDAWASYERVAEDNREKWLTWAAACLLLGASVTSWLAGSLRRRKEVEAALRESEERFRSLANTAPVMIVASGPDGGATFFNKTWLNFTGRAVEQELGYGWMESVHPEDRDRTRAEFTSCFAERTNCNLEYRLRRADGAYRHVACTGVPRFEPDGAFMGYTASGIDLTDIHRAQQELHAQQNLESLGSLAGGIAHDFNNLLGGAMAYAELAQVKFEQGASPEDELLQICSVAARGSEIVRQLMIFAGKERGTLEPVDVSAVVAEMLQLLKVSISKHALLKTDLGDSLPAIRANAAQIRQVVMNLVTNASEAIGDRDGVIRVRTGPAPTVTRASWLETKNLLEGDYLLLEVSDSGCGMSPETQRKLFDPFFTTKFAGRGMGLAVVQRIVRELAGAIHVESSMGHGTSVKIVLPCAYEMAPRNHVADDVPAGPDKVLTQVSTTLLIVEDEPALMAGVSKMLQRKGFTVIQASDGSSALELIRAVYKPIDAMLLDITLPGVSSREVFEEANRLRPDLTVILTSAYSQETVVASFHGLAIEHFIRKPFRAVDLIRLLQSASSVRSAKQPMKL